MDGGIASHFDDNKFLVLIANNVLGLGPMYSVTVEDYMRIVHALNVELITTSISDIDWGTCNVPNHKSFLQQTMTQQLSFTQSMEDGIPNAECWQVAYTRTRTLCAQRMGAD